MTDQPKSFDEWAILEIMGHQRFSGRVSEQAIGGASFVRVDVPETKRDKPFSKFFGASSIFCITPVSEATARAAAEQFAPRIVTLRAARADARQDSAG
jgi:hypothetical protein